MRVFNDYEQQIIDFYISVYAKGSHRLPVASSSAAHRLRIQCHTLVKKVRTEWAETGLQAEAKTAMDNVGIRFVEPASADNSWQVEFFRKTDSDVMSAMAGFVKSHGGKVVEPGGMTRAEEEAAARFAEKLQRPTVANPYGNALKAASNSSFAPPPVEVVTNSTNALNSTRIPAPAPTPVRKIRLDGSEPWPDDFDPMNYSDPRHPLFDDSSNGSKA